MPPLRIRRLYTRLNYLLGRLERTELDVRTKNHLYNFEAFKDCSEWLYFAVEEFASTESEEAKAERLADASFRMAAKAIPRNELVECAACYAVCLKGIANTSRSVAAKIKANVLSQILNNGKEEYIAFRKAKRDLKNAVLDMDGERFKHAHSTSLEPYCEPETKRAAERIFLIQKNTLEVVMQELNTCMLRQKKGNKALAHYMTEFHSTALDILYDFKQVTVSE